MKKMILASDIHENSPIVNYSSYTGVSEPATLCDIAACPAAVAASLDRFRSASAV